MAFVRTNPDARPLYQLKPGRPLQVATDGAGGLVALRFRTGDGERLTVARESGALVATRAPGGETVRLTLKSGEINTSLFGAADAIGLPDAVTIALAELFAGDIDFLQDLRFGDRFSVLYEIPLRRRRAGRRRSHRRCGVREPRPATERLPVARCRRAGRLVHARRAQHAQRLPAFADGVFAHDLRVLARAPASDPADVARPPGRRLRRADRHAGAGHRRRCRHARRREWRVRQRGHVAPHRHLLDALRAPVALRGGDSQRGARAAGRHDRLRRRHRLGDRSAPALRVPGQRRAAQSADRRAAHRGTAAPRDPRQPSSRTSGRSRSNSRSRASCRCRASPPSISLCRANSTPA